jgi:hypothetical protein
MFESVRVVAMYDGAEIAIAEGPGNMRDARAEVLAEIDANGFMQVSDCMEFHCTWENAETGGVTGFEVMTYAKFRTWAGAYHG